MLALSTSWISGRSDKSSELVQAVEKHDVSGVELEYRITETLMIGLKDALKASTLKAVSIHNYFPHPSIASASSPSGDLFRLSSLVDEEWKQAVFWTRNTIRNAAEFGAGVVVLHCGNIEMDTEEKRLRNYYHQGNIQTTEAQELIRQKKAERDGLKQPYFDRLSASLTLLCRDAEREGIVLGLENRAHYHELPTMDDFEVLFREFSGGPVGYWHDTGHAHANEALTMTGRHELLEKYSGRLVGIHLHDAQGFADHKAPGLGDIDFDRIRDFLPDEALRVVELKPGTPEQDITSGLSYLRSKGIE